MTSQKGDLKITHPILHCFAGGVAGTVGTVVMSPLEVLKVRLQSSNLSPDTKRLGMIRLMKDIVIKEGASSLYKGLVPNLVGVLPSRAIFFASYQFTKGFYTDMIPSVNTMYFMSAITSSFITSTLTNPIWLIKTRMQIDQSRQGQGRLTTYQCIRNVFREEGVRGFYRGLSASYLGSLDTAANFGFYEYLKRKLLVWYRGCQPEKNGAPFNPCRSQLQSRSEAALAFCASFISKLSAVVFTYPHEVLRTRLREPGNKYKGLVNTLLLVYREEGFVGLYGGIGAHCVRVVPITCITLSTYELVVYLLERNDDV